MANTNAAILKTRATSSALEHALVLHRKGKLAEAIAAYFKALPTAENPAEVYNNLGVAYRALGKPAPAAACYRRALSLNPKAPGIYVNLGNVLRETGDHLKARTAHQRALKFAPNQPQALFNAALTDRDLGDLAEARKKLKELLHQNPQHGGARVELALTDLLEGNWESGFPALDIRLKNPGHAVTRADIPLWNGAALTGKTLLINSEGGARLHLLLSRFAPYLARAGAKVIWEAPKLLHPILSTLKGIAQLIEPGTPVNGVDVQVPLLSLPARFKTTQEHVPKMVPYLTAPQGTGPRLNIRQDTRLAVGLAWGRWDGKVTPGAPRLDDFLEIAGLEGAEIFSLQCGPLADEITHYAMEHLIHDTGTQLTDLGDLARALLQLDLVIATDSITAHLAAALGKPTWVLTGPGQAWYWLAAGNATPFYPNVQIFRRAADAPWQSAAQDVRKMLTRVLKGEV